MDNVYNLVSVCWLIIGVSLGYIVGKQIQPRKPQRYRRRRSPNEQKQSEISPFYSECKTCGRPFNQVDDEPHDCFECWSKKNEDEKQ